MWKTIFFSWTSTSLLSPSSASPAVSRGLACRPRSTCPGPTTPRSPPCITTLPLPSSPRSPRPGLLPAAHCSPSACGPLYSPAPPPAAQLPSPLAQAATPQPNSRRPARPRCARALPNPSAYPALSQAVAVTRRTRAAPRLPRRTLCPRGMDADERRVSSPKHGRPGAAAALHALATHAYKSRAAAALLPSPQRRRPLLHLSSQAAAA